MAKSKPSLRAPVQDRSQRTLDALLDAAEKLLRTRSYLELSLTDLVREAGVTTGAFYARFTSKDDLLPCLYERYLIWLGNVIERELPERTWQRLAVSTRAVRAADLICRLFEKRSGLLRAMVVYSRLQPSAQRRKDVKGGGDPTPQLVLLQTICDRLREGLPDPPARDRIEFAVYSTITLAREATLYPGLPMCAAMKLDPAGLRMRLAGLLQSSLIKTP